MSRGQGESDQELLKEVIEEWVEQEGELLIDADNNAIEPDEVRARAERLNRLVRLADDDWLQLDVDQSIMFSEDDIEALVEGTF